MTDLKMYYSTHNGQSIGVSYIKIHVIKVHYAAFCIIQALKKNKPSVSEMRNGIFGPYTKCLNAFLQLPCTPIS